MSPQYFLCLNANMAFHGGVCGNIPFECGGLVLACRLLHARCVELRLKTRDADDELEDRAPREPGAEPPPYNYEALVEGDIPSPQVDECTMRIAKSSRRTTEDDEPPSEQDLRRIHWWALCVCLNTFEAIDEIKPGVLVGTGPPTGGPVADLYALEPVPRDDGHVGLGAAGVGKESEDHPGEVEEDGLFYVGEGGPEAPFGGARDASRSTTLCGLATDDVQDPFRLQDKLAEAVGDLELPLLDADASAVGNLRFIREKLGNNPCEDPGGGALIARGGRVR